MLVVGVTLMVGHWAALPQPQADDVRLEAAVTTLQRGAGPHRWVALHVVYGKCRCSERILEHLFARSALPDVSETILFVGSSPEYEQEAKRHGYSVLTTKPAELARHYGIAAAPLLVVANSAGRIEYVGGYTDRKQGPDVRDVAIIRGLEHGARATRLPVFGCAVSRSLQKLLDPLGLKYRDSV